MPVRIVTYTSSTLELLRGWNYWWLTSGNTHSNYFRPANSHAFSMSADTHIKQISSLKAVRLHFVFGSDHSSHQIVILSLSLPRTLADFLPDKGVICVRLALPVYQQFLHQRLYLKSNCQFPHIYRGKQRVIFQRLPCHLQRNQSDNRTGEVWYDSRIQTAVREDYPWPSKFTKIHSRFYCRTHRLLSLWQPNPRGLPK